MSFGSSSKVSKKKVRFGMVLKEIDAFVDYVHDLYYNKGIREELKIIELLDLDMYGTWLDIEKEYCYISIIDL